MHQIHTFSTACNSLVPASMKTVLAVAKVKASHADSLNPYALRFKTSCLQTNYVGTFHLKCKICTICTTRNYLTASPMRLSCIIMGPGGRSASTVSATIPRKAGKLGWGTTGLARPPGRRSCCRPWWGGKAAAWTLPRTVTGTCELQKKTFKLLFTTIACERLQCCMAENSKESYEAICRIWKEICRIWNKICKICKKYIQNIRLNMQNNMEKYV